MRILCISAQKPDSTGSGVYLAETVASLAAAGHQVAVIVGIDKDDSPQLAPGVEFLPVRFRTPELPFPVCGMSDVMPYEATRYRDMTPEMVQAFRSVFGQRIRDAVLDFKPDAVICHHLYLACSAACDVLDDLAGEYRSPIAQGSGLAKGRPCQIWGVCHSTDLRQLYNHDLEKDRITAAVRSLDGVMALHEAQKAEIAELFDLPADRIRVVGTGYNSQEFAPRAGLRAAHPLRVLYVGKICRARGVESLIRAMGLLPPRSASRGAAPGGRLQRPGAIRSHRRAGRSLPFPGGVRRPRFSRRPGAFL
ncbi:glycosyltransferase [Senegalimassilia anaerobia]